jgi:hypothetical protein
VASKATAASNKPRKVRDGFIVISFEEVRRSMDFGTADCSIHADRRTFCRQATTGFCAA